MIVHSGSLSLILLTLALSATPVRADYYRYTDEQGSLCFVDDSNKIPAPCRGSATLVREAKPAPPEAEAADPYLSRPPSHDGTPFIAPSPTPAPTPPPRAPSATASNPRNWGWLALYLVAAGASLVLLCQLLKSLQSRQLARVILFGATVGILLFGYKLYVDQMVSNYFTVKGKVLQLLEKTMQRVDRTDNTER